MLAVHGLFAGYGYGDVLFDLDLDIQAGEVVGLLGRNGMGKTTTIRAIMGLAPVRRGEVVFEGQRLPSRRAFFAARAGIGLVPEGRLVFPTLSVRENLIATARPGSDKGGWTLERVWSLFPGLKERESHLGSQLSGGEQQMLAVGRALMINPKLLILDEATEGLAPLIRRNIWHCLSELKRQGQSILIVDKDLLALSQLCQRHYILEKGRIVWRGTSAELLASRDVQHRHIGVSHASIDV